MDILFQTVIFQTPEPWFDSGNLKSPIYGVPLHVLSEPPVTQRLLHHQQKQDL